MDLTDAEQLSISHAVSSGWPLTEVVERIVADRVAAAKAEAWKRGHASCPCHSEPERHQHRNPYRTT